MSTLKVAAINNPDALSGGLAISAAGLVSGSGMDLILTQAFTGQSAVSINNCFSSEYENYQIRLSHYNTTNTAGMTLAMRMRASGVDVTTGYLSAIDSYYTDSSLTTLFRLNTTTFMYLSYAGGSAWDTVVADVFRPYLSTSSDITGSSLSANPITANLKSTIGGKSPSGVHDGFTIYPSLGVIDGRISVYGLRN